MNRRKMGLFCVLALLGTAPAISVKHDLGTLELKTPAKRVVALEYSFLDTLVALGVKPIGGALGREGGDRGAPPYLAPHLKGVSATGSRAQPSLEAIAALKPDLILADSLIHKEVIPQLARLAPTAVYPSRRASLDDLNAQTLAIGQLVGREAQARRILAEQATLMKKARLITSKKAPALVTAVTTPTTLTIHTSGSFAGSYLEEMGRKNLLPVKDGQTQYQTSLEALVALAPQTLVLFTAPDEKPVTDQWKNNPLWQKIPAVKRGRVYQFNRDNWTRGRGPISLKLMVAETIESRLLQDGAPTGKFRYE